MTFLIGISGKARSGKNYLANELRSILAGSEIYSLANAMKCYCRVLGLMTVKDGSVLQTVGTDVYRKKDASFWVRMLQYQIEEEKPNIAIIPDIRFPNEKEWVESSGGIVIRTIRINEDDSMYYTDDRPRDHLSEIALDNEKFEHILCTKSGDLKSFQEYAQDIVVKLCIKK